MTNQSDRQASVRATTGTTLTLNGDWIALFDAVGAAAGTFNERMIDYARIKTGTTYSNINEGMDAIAVSEGYDRWDSMATFTPGAGGAAPGQNVDLQDGTDLSFQDGTDYTYQ